MRDIKSGRSDGLDDGVERPESASDRVIAAAHRPTRVVLADGAAERILAVGARAAATTNFIPINRVVSRVEDDGWKQNAKQGKFGCCFHKCIGVGSSADELKKWFVFMLFGCENSERQLLNG